MQFSAQHLVVPYPFVPLGCTIVSIPSITRILKVP